MRRIVALAGLMFCSWALGAEQPKLPLPEMVVGRTLTAPKIDGKIEPGEWDRAPACTAFVRAFEGTLSPIQTTARITYDDKYVYVAFTNFRGEHLKLLSKKGRRIDDEAIVFDPSNEIWLTPPVSPATTYQTLFNSYPAVLDAKVIPSVGYTAKSWSGKWEIAASESKESWTVEARALISAFGVEKIEDGANWRALFTADIFADGNAFRAWAPGGAFVDIPRHGTLHFRDDAPVFQLLNVESIFTGKPSFQMGVTGLPKRETQVTVRVRFGTGVEPAADDVVQQQVVRLASGKHSEFSVSADLSSAKLPVRKIVVDPKSKIERECPHGFCEVKAVDETGLILYSQTFPFVVSSFVRTPPKEIIASPYETPFGLEAFYAPLSKKLLVKIDRLYLPARASAAAGEARLVDGSGKLIAQRKIAPFRQDYSEFPIDLADLKVPVETEQDWLAAQPVAEENRKIADENKKLKAAGKSELPLKDVPGPKPAEYKLEVSLADGAGASLAATSIPVKLMGYEFEWLGNNVGISDKVIPPWTPMQWRDGVASMWNKAYELNGLGLAEKITNSNAPQLAGAMKLIATVDGKEVDVASDKPSAQKTAEASLDLAGAGKAAAMDVSVKTRVEFDGFVMNEMTVQPTTANVQRLALVVKMPEAESPCFVTTSGGWSAYHGWTPAKWDSRETTLGSFNGNFVPYVFLTDSERGFCWFADTDKGWILDPSQPTIELFHENGNAVLRVNFINKPGMIEKPTTMRYGWMVTPAKPQPKGWRGYHISNDALYPQATCMFWSDADWAVLWPYYSSPFPRDYAKSRAMLEGSTKRGTVGCVGSIAHAIARYADYKWRWFNALAADWGSTPGDLSNGNVARGRGPNDFQVWHYDRWVKQSGLRGLYFDETYLSEDWNYLTGGAYLLPDERVQPGYNYLGLREYYKRLRYMFHENNVPQPNLWLHTTSGHPVYAWMPDLAMEAENVEPVGGENDYIEALPPSRLRSIDMGRNLGAAPTVMCQTDRHWNPNSSPALVHQFVGWVLSHDVLPEGVPFWGVLASELGLWRDDVTFVSYWKRKGAPADVNISAHVRPNYAVVWAMNTARQERKADIRLDEFGIAPSAIAFDAETGERLAVADGRVLVNLPSRMWRCVRLVEPKMLKGNQTFIARFDKEVAADECLGAAYPRGRSIIASVPGGREGNGAPLDEPLTFGTRHHVTREGGRISFAVKFANTNPAAQNLLSIGDVRVGVNKGKLTAALTGKKNLTLATENVLLKADQTWHEITIQWRDRELQVACDGSDAKITLEEPMPIQPMGRGLDICDYRLRTQPTWITFGPVKGAIMDDLTMER